MHDPISLRIPPRCTTHRCNPTPTIACKPPVVREALKHTPPHPGAVFPTNDMILSHILVVTELDRAVHFYRDILGAKLFREYGGTTAVFDFNGAWLVIVTGGGPTPDKPNVAMAAPLQLDRVSHSMTIRVKDCHAAYQELQARGAPFLTPPVESEWEVRAFFRDPDGHLLEISQAKQ